MAWTRKRASWWLAIALPGLLLRALVPIGFMPAFGAGQGVALVLCDGLAHHAHHSGAPEHREHDPCPFGSSPASAVAGTWRVPPLALQRSAVPVLLQPQIRHFEFPARAQSPRAPPIGA